MKRIVMLVLSFLVISVASAENTGEITFQSIPWLSNETIVNQSLTENGYLRDGTRISLSHDRSTYLLMDDMNFVTPDRVMWADDVTFVSDLDGIEKNRIAGYPVKDLILTFAYNGEYKLIAARVELINGNYEDLKAKLTKVYGEAETKGTEEGIWSTVWKGENNSAVVLYTQSDGSSYTLMYGRLDATEILQNCLAPADPDDVSGL